MFKVYCKDINCKPEKAHRTDAGYDVRAADDYFINYHEVTKVRCGFHMEIPPGYVGLLFPRSGLATKEDIILANTVGVIDADYRGEVICAMRRSRGYGTQKIKKYDRIAQLVIVPIAQELGMHVASSLDQLSTTQRGDGGFGHTGKH